jgi:endonuclease III-like uncharacterized protein
MNFPQAISTSKFSEIVADKGPNHVLNWRDSEKPTRMIGLIDFLLSQNLETVDDLSGFLEKEGNREQLLAVRGVGPKTVDYLKMLVGIPSVAVDRHIFRFVELAGIESANYDQARSAVEEAAGILAVDISVLDHSILSYMSKQKS